MSGPKPKQKTAIVIGAGIGGVSTAARLAKAGFKVTVLEKNDFSGGRCSLIHHEGWRFDQGPSLLLLPKLFHQTFSDLGTSLSAEGVTLLKCDPNYNIWFGDGEQFRLSTDVAAMKTEIEKWEGKDGFERYLSFLQESHRHYELSVTHVLLQNFTSIFSMMRPSFLRHLIALHPFESIYSRASKYFWTERLRRVFTFGSMYMGMSPFDAPGTYSLLQYTELAEGIWYPVGGFHKVVEALVEVGERMGVDYRLSTSVSKINLSSDGSRATGVVLDTGETISADVVVNNSDLVYAYNKLLPPTPYAQSLSERPASCSSISFYWALDRKIDRLEAHNIFLADEYRESFDSIFKKHLIPNQPSFYVNVPSRVDPTAAPAGKDSIVVLVPVGHLLTTDETKARKEEAGAEADPRSASSKGDKTKLTKSSHASGILPSESQNWPEMIALARRTILSTISSRIGTDIEPYIVHEESNDPNSWQTRFNLDRGAILGLSHSFFNVLSFRPSTRARRGGALDGWASSVLGPVAGALLGKKLGQSIAQTAGQVSEVLFSGGSIERLYFVGASSHPGTGVPICLAGGRLVAEQVCEDFGIRIPWTAGQLDANIGGQKEIAYSKQGDGSAATGAGTRKVKKEIDTPQTQPLLSTVHWALLLLTISWAWMATYITSHYIDLSGLTPANIAASIDPVKWATQLMHALGFEKLLALAEGGNPLGEEHKYLVLPFTMLIIGVPALVYGLFPGAEKVVDGEGSLGKKFKAGGKGEWQFAKGVNGRGGDGSAGLGSGGAHEWDFKAGGKTEWKGI